MDPRYYVREHKSWILENLELLPHPTLPGFFQIHRRTGGLFGNMHKGYLSCSVLDKIIQGHYIAFVLFYGMFPPFKLSSKSKTYDCFSKDDLSLGDTVWDPTASKDWVWDRDSGLTLADIDALGHLDCEAGTYTKPDGTPVEFRSVTGGSQRIYFPRLHKAIYRHKLVWFKYHGGTWNPPGTEVRHIGSKLDDSINNLYLHTFKQDS